MRFGAVLFDWMLTLAYYPTPTEHVVLALESLGRPRDKATVGALVERLAAAGRDPEIQALKATEDVAPEDLATPTSSTSPGPASTTTSPRPCTPSSAPRPSTRCTPTPRRRSPRSTTPASPSAW
ncbi:MAG: hypothetical protein S0880_16215 [Actinomycetota bacterium]|nr:hypothetical protein [Actinomycetota bacterium]